MARPSPDLLMAQILHGYLDTPESRAMGVPAAADCALCLMDDGKEETVPSMLVAGTELKGKKTAGGRIVVVTVFLKSLLKSEEEDAPTDEESLAQVKARPELSLWMDAVESRLRNESALSAYIASLESSVLEGWNFMNYQPLGQEEMKREKMWQFTHSCSVNITLAWPPLV